MEITIGTEQIMKAENCCSYIPKHWSRGCSGVKAANGNWHTKPIPEHIGLASVEEARFMIDGCPMSYYAALDKLTTQLESEQEALQLLQLYYNERKAQN